MTEIQQGLTQVSFPQLNDLKYSNCVDFFKVYQTPRCNFSKTGNVQYELDHIIKKQVFYQRGAVSSANKFNVPAKINQNLCMLPHSYIYLQISPDVSFYQHKDDKSYSASHCIITFTCVATNGTYVKVVLSTLVSQPKVSANAIYVPFRLRRWSTIVVNMTNLFEKVFNGSYHYKGFVQTECTATCAVKGIYFSNYKYSPYDAPIPLYMPPPPKCKAIPPNLLNYYDWIEVGFEQVKVAQVPPYLISNKDIFSHNISYAVAIEKQAVDFLQEREQFEQQEIKQQQLELRKKEMFQDSKKMVTSKSHLSQQLSTYKLAASVQPEKVEEKQEIPPKPKRVSYVYVQPKKKQVVAKQEEPVEEQQVVEQNNEEVEQDVINPNIPITDDQQDNQILTDAVKNGQNQLDTNFENINNKLQRVQIVKKNINQQFLQLFNKLNTAFLSSGKIERNTFHKRLSEVTPYSQLEVLYSIGCEVQAGISNNLNYDSAETSNVINKDQFSSNQPDIINQQVVNFINNQFNARVLHVNNNIIKINKIERKFQKNIAYLYQSNDSLLLNHKHVASVYSKSLNEQIVIGHDFVIQEIIQQICKEEDVLKQKELQNILQKIESCDLLFIGACQTSCHFVIVFKFYLCIFGYQFLSEEDKKIKHTTNTIAIQLIAIQLTQLTQITHFECCHFNDQKLILVGTNRPKCTLNLSVFSLDTVGSLSDGWLQTDYSKIVILNNPINLESLHNQQKHEEIFKIIDISDNQYLTISPRQMRLIRIKNDELKFMIIPFDFVTEEKEICTQLKQNFKEKLVNIKISEMFNNELSGVCDQIVMNTQISDGGVVPGSNNQLIYLLMNSNAFIVVSLQKLLTRSATASSYFILHNYVPVSFVLMFSDNRIASTDMGGKLMFHSFDSKKIEQFTCDINFSNYIIDMQKVNGFENQAQKDQDRLVSSNLLSNYSNYSKESDQQKIQISTLQNVGEYGILSLADQQDQNNYQSIFQTLTSNIIDFQFDPVHAEEIALVTLSNLNIFSNQTRKILLHLGNSSQDNFNISSNNVLAYSPSKYVICYFEAYTNSFSLVDLDQQEAIFSSSQIFKNIAVPQSAVHGGRVCMHFSKSGDYLLLSNSNCNLVIYETQNNIKFLQSFDIKLQQFQMTQLIKNNQIQDVIIGLTSSGEIALSTINNLKNRQGFRFLNINKQPLNFLNDRRNNCEYVPLQNLISQFYTEQIKYVQKLLTESRETDSCANSVHIIHVQPLNNNSDIVNVKYLGRRSQNIQASSCIPNLIALIIEDSYLIVNPDNQQNQKIICLSLETYNIHTGICLQSHHISCVLQNYKDQQQFQTYLLQNKVYGTYLFGISTANKTYLMNVNCLFKQPTTQPRICTFQFQVSKMQQSADSQRIALCSQQNSLFVFAWNCSDFGAESELQQFNDQVMSCRIEGVLSTTGSVFQVFVGSRSDVE